jgi:hypothetical protein
VLQKLKELRAKVEHEACAGFQAQIDRLVGAIWALDKSVAPSERRMRGAHTWGQNYGTVGAMHRGLVAAWAYRLAFFIYLLDPEWPDQIALNNELQVCEPKTYWYTLLLEQAEASVRDAVRAIGNTLLARADSVLAGPVAAAKIETEAEAATAMRMSVVGTIRQFSAMIASWSGIYHCDLDDVQWTSDDWPVARHRLRLSFAAFSGKEEHWGPPECTDFKEDLESLHLYLSAFVELTTILNMPHTLFVGPPPPRPQPQSQTQT